MGRTKINVSAVVDATSQINSAKSSVSSAKSAFTQTKNSIDGKIQNRSNIRNRLNTVQTQLSGIDSQIGKIRTMVQSGANMYRSADERVEFWRDDIKNNVGAKAAASVLSNWSSYFISGSTNIVRSNQYVLRNTKLVGEVDYTAEFINGRPRWLDILAFAWSSDWLGNILSLIDIGENLNEKAVRDSIETLIKNTIEDEHALTVARETIVDAMTPEDVLNIKKVVDYTIQQGKVCNELEIAALLKMDVSQVRECDYLRLLQNQTDLAFYNGLKKGLDSTLGVVVNGVKYADITAKMLEKLTNDYTEDLKYLEHIREAMIESGYEQDIVNQTINKIEQEYNNQFEAAVEFGFNELARSGIDKISGSKLILEKGAEAVIGETLMMLDLSLAAKDIGCLVSGLSEKSENITMIYTTQQYSYALVEGYETYANKIRQGDYTQDDVEKCKIYFDLAKNAKIQEYEAMVNLYESALEDSEPSFSMGVIKGISSAFRNTEEKTAVVNEISNLNSEISRLKGSECFAPTGGGGSSGGRGSSRSF